MWTILASLAVATLISEDLACLAAGTLVARGTLGLPAAAGACAVGIFAGDLLLYAVGRLGGARALSWRPVYRRIPAAQVERASQWLERGGAAVVLLSRFTPGLRLPTYLAAGILRASPGRFAFYLLLAALIWTPLLVGAAAWLGRLPQWWALALPAVTVMAAPRVFPYRRRRLLWGFLQRKLRWEFWPVWAAYLPLAPYLLWLALRHRSLTLFTAANPGIAGGGLTGESKSRILEHLAAAEPDRVPPFLLLPASLPAWERLRRAREFVAQNRLGWPVVLKPDAGERGAGVRIVRDGATLAREIRDSDRDVIVQGYVRGEEFGIFYWRRPADERGHVPSITAKRFPTVTGDGRTPVRDLILADARAVCMARTYFARALRRLDSVPAAGEVVPLAEIGSHCRGAVFLDARRLWTAELERAADRLAQAHPGFFLGRFDVRSESAQALREGRFQVIELNGVAAEPAHIYDPAVTILEAYGALAWQWRAAFETGAANRTRGAAVTGLRELAALVLGRR